MKNKVLYDQVGGLRPGKTVFDLSHEVKFDGDMSYLYPILFEECVPGDTFKIGNQLVVRFNPLVAPIMNEVNAYFHYFFVPSRLLMLEKDVPVGSSIPPEHLWDKFISGGDITDKDTLALEGDSIELPRWEPEAGGYAIGSLWDYFGFPIGIKPDKYHCPLSFYKRAYNFIWNEYYRASEIQEEVDLDSDDLLKVNWKRDYFTSALPWQQKGVAPALPVTITGDIGISGEGEVVFSGSSSNGGQATSGIRTFDGYTKLYAIGETQAATRGVSGTVDGSQFTGSTSELIASTFDVSDLRLATQIQKYLERNARAGSGRYTTWLRAHFGVSPSDSRLDRPEYIGGSKSPVVFSEVLQTSSTDDVTPQGNLAGHGLVADSNYIASYHVEEFGYIVGLLNIVPKASYQQGIERQALRKTKYDFYLPEFAHLSERSIETAEIYATEVEADNSDIFGYTGIYNEMRGRQSKVCGNLRDDLSYWHQGRIFAEKPILNGSFLECNPRKDIFAVPSQPGLIIDVANIVKAARPMPLIAEPGFADHF